MNNYQANLMQLITTRKVAHNHMIIKLINISYITKFLYINGFCTMDSNCYM